VNTLKASLTAAGLLILSTLLTLLVACPKPSASRSVSLLQPADATTPPKFSREASTGLFVGMREFPHDKLLEVPYACDDAVDLAYRFVFNQRVALLPPRRVVLAISGSPQKEESRRRLRELGDAGARIVRNATADDVLDLLKEQAARAGREGLFVLSIASHGFQQNGDAYILGSTSDFDSPGTALRTNTILDVAAQASRSLIFIDACRERVQEARGAAPDPAAAAPLIQRMNRVQGQAIFYAAAPGGYAFDDPVRQNGVFTEAVLDGLDCGASAPGGTVLVETLHTYVDRAVRRWIRDNKDRTVNPATQVSMEGQTRNMALCQCWRPPGPGIRVALDHTILTAYSEDTSPLWRKDFGEPIVDAKAVDLDADALSEVVVGFRNRIVVLDRDGQPRWTRTSDARTLQTFTIGDLFEKHTNQIVALWNDSHSSRLSVLESDGRERSSLGLAGPLLHVAIGRPTNMHAPKIVVATANALMLFHPRKLDRDTPVWRQLLRIPANAISAVRIVDPSSGRLRDIAVTTASGTTRFTFEGKIVGEAGEGNWQEGTRRKKR
jgi:caspase domain-containing protein